MRKELREKAEKTIREETRQRFETTQRIAAMQFYQYGCSVESIAARCKIPTEVVEAAIREHIAQQNKELNRLADKLFDLQEVA